MNHHLSFQTATKAGGSEPPAKGIDGRTHSVSYNPKVTHQSYSYTFLINFNWQLFEKNSSLLKILNSFGKHRLRRLTNLAIVVKTVKSKLSRRFIL